MTTGADVLSLIKEKEIRYVDLRFTDTRGKEQHVTVPASQVDAKFFAEGKMFDGSSISGWKGINESDMILMPDATTAVADPFFEDPTLIVRCDVLEPATMQGYDRDPRSVAKRAEAYLKSTGIADGALFGPENEFFIFDSVRWQQRHARLLAMQDRFPSRAHGIPTRSIRKAIPATVPASRAATSRCRRSMRSRTSARAMCNVLEEMGMVGRSASPRSGHCRPVRNRCRFRRLVRKADEVQMLKYVVHNVAHLLWQDRYLHAEAPRRRQRFRHARAPVLVEGWQEPVRRRRLRRPVRNRAVLHRRHHQPGAAAHRALQLPRQRRQVRRAGRPGPRERPAHGRRACGERVERGPRLPAQPAQQALPQVLAPVHPRVEEAPWHRVGALQRLAYHRAAQRSRRSGF